MHIEILAKLSLVSFTQEVMLANHLAQFHPQASEQFKADFVRLMREPILPPGPATSAEEQQEAAIAQRAVEMAEKFIENVSNREVLIRFARIGEK